MQSSIREIGTLQVIFKIAERCNLNCPYCYYFSGADTAVNERPPLISRSVIEMVGAFLQQAVLDMKIGHVQIIFHGGEPTLVRPSVIDHACSYIANSLESTEFSFGIQTNGVHLSEEWLSLLSKYKISTGVSLDGPKDLNEAHRPAHR